MLKKNCVCQKYKCLPGNSSIASFISSAYIHSKNIRGSGKGMTRGRKNKDLWNSKSFHVSSLGSASDLDTHRPKLPKAVSPLQQTSTLRWMSSLTSQPNTSRLIPEILARLASAHTVRQISWFMPAGDKRSHGCLATVVIISPISRKIQGMGVWEDFTDSWSYRTQSRQIAGGLFRVISCTDPELVGHQIVGALFPLAETRELVPPDCSCLPLCKVGRLDPQPASDDQCSPSTASEMKGKTRNVFSFSRGSCEIADQPHPSPYTETTPQLLTTCLMAAALPAACSQHVFLVIPF